MTCIRKSSARTACGPMRRRLTTESGVAPRCGSRSGWRTLPFTRPGAPRWGRAARPGGPAGTRRTAPPPSPCRARLPPVAWFSTPTMVNSPSSTSTISPTSRSAPARRIASATPAPMTHQYRSTSRSEACPSAPSPRRAPGRRIDPSQARSVPVLASHHQGTTTSSPAESPSTTSTESSVVRPSATARRCTPAPLRSTTRTHASPPSCSTASIGTSSAAPVRNSLRHA